MHHSRHWRMMDKEMANALHFPTADYYHLLTLLLVCHMDFVVKETTRQTGYHAEIICRGRKERKKERGSN
jgi:hypothetical protein